MELLLKYFKNLTPSQIEQFELLEDIYKFWNTKINVISRKDIDNFYMHHVLHSLSIASFYNLPKASKIVDVGTGGGFPGIPLAIFYPEIQFSLIDSIGKKINVVKEVAATLKLKNVEIYQSRIENEKRKWDIVVSRAVTSLPIFYNLVKNQISDNENININGILYLKGGNIDEEIKEFKSIEIKNISEIYKEDYFITKQLVYIKKIIILNNKKSKFL